MKKIIEELLKPRTLFAALFYITYCSMLWDKINPPEALYGIVNLILGFYFGSKVKTEQGGQNES